MQIIRDLSELNLLSGQWCADGEQFALVPTMGALHDGHLALIAEAKRRAERVVATIFVNPTQFNDPADLQRYPRTEQEDVARLRDAGCDAVWIPVVDDMYPRGFATTVLVAGVSERWEGEHRPGHFDGVATIVAKLLVATLPNLALFGEKDWQQLAVIRRLEQDLQIGVDIVGVPTVREADGLALSSRNALLPDTQRAKAVALPNALADARDAIAEGKSVAAALAEARQSLEDAGFSKIDYVALVDAGTLEPLDAPGGDMRLIAAASIAGVRLIDNLEI